MMWLRGVRDACTRHVTHVRGVWGETRPISGLLVPHLRVYADHPSPVTFRTCATSLPRAFVLGGGGSSSRRHSSHTLRRAAGWMKSPVNSEAKGRIWSKVYVVLGWTAA